MEKSELFTILAKTLVAGERAASLRLAICAERDKKVLEADVREILNLLIDVRVSLEREALVRLEKGEQCRGVREGPSYSLFTQ